LLAYASDTSVTPWVILASAALALVWWGSDRPRRARRQPGAHFARPAPASPFAGTDL